MSQGWADLFEDLGIERIKPNNKSASNPTRSKIVWTEESIKQYAQQYTTLREWSKGHKKSWIAAKNRGVKFVMKVAIHMEEVSPNENYPPKISRKTIFWTDSLRMYCAKLKMSHRVKLGLERAQQEGKSIGRPYGSTIDDDEYLKKYSDVVEDVFELSLRKCMLKHKVSKGTVIKLRKILSRKRYNLQKPGLS